MIRWVFVDSVSEHIGGLRKPFKTRYMIETMILHIKDLEEKRFFIRKYNAKLKRLGIEEKYEPIPFEEV